MIHGENLIVAIGGTPLAASKSCNVSKAQSFLEVAAPTAGRWESFVPQKLGWNITADCLMGTMDAYKTLDAAWKAGTALTIRFYDTEFNENETGTAYIENLDLTATKGNLAKMSVSLKGSGPLSEYAGVEIPMTMVYSEQIGYLFSEYAGHPIAEVSQDDGDTRVYTITLTKQTKCKFVLGNSDIVIIGGDRILDGVYHEDTIYLEDDADDWGSTTLEKMLPAGTHYVMFSLVGQTQISNAKVYKLSL